MIGCKLDWLAFTWKASTFIGPQEEDLDEFGLFMKSFPEFYKDPDGMLLLRNCGANKWYDHVLQFNEKMMISYNVDRVNGLNPDMEQGINVSVPAHGLGYFFDLFGYSWDHVDQALEDLRKRGCQFSRLDFAYDDYTKTFKPQDYSNWLMNGQLVTNFRSFRFVGNSRLDRRGGCFYLGKRSAGRILRIYDKDFESNGEIPAIRYEFEVHGKHTERFVDFIIENNQFPDFENVLNEWIKKVVREGSDGTRRMREPLPEWEAFLDSVKLSVNAENEDEKPKLAPITKPKDTSDQFERGWEWICRQVAPTLHSYAVMLGFDVVAKALDKAGFSRSYQALQNLYYIDPKRYSSIRENAGVKEYGRDYRTFW